jgi:class 3 adenylate cyclase
MDETSSPAAVADSLPAPLLDADLIAQRPFIQTFRDPAVETAFRAFVFSGRLISGVIASMVSTVFIYVLVLYHDGHMPWWVTALNAVGIAVTFPTGAFMLFSATWGRRVFTITTIDNSDPLDPSNPDPVSDVGGQTYAVKQQAHGRNRPTISKLQHRIANHEEYGLTVIFGTAMVVQAVSMYAKYTGCVVDYGPVDCVDYVDIYLIALLECFCVIAPARFVLVFPTCVLALALLGLSYVWTNVHGVDGSLHAQRVGVECAVAVINFVSCWYRETGLRQAFMNKLSTDAAMKEASTVGQTIRELTAKMLPDSQLKRLLSHRTTGTAGNAAAHPAAVVVPRHFDVARRCTVYRSDLVGFTAWSTRISSEELVTVLSTLTAEFDHAANEAKVEKVKTIGDAYWAVSGLPETVIDAPERIVKFAVASLDAATSVFATLGADASRRPGGIRIGVGTGAGFGTIVGQQQISYEIFGEANDIACALEPASLPGRILICDATRASLLAYDVAGVVTSKPLSDVVFAGGRSVKPSLLAKQGTEGELFICTLEAEQPEEPHISLVSSAQPSHSNTPSRSPSTTAFVVPEPAAGSTSDSGSPSGARRRHPSLWTASSSSAKKRQTSGGCDQGSGGWRPPTFDLANTPKEDGASQFSSTAITRVAERLDGLLVGGAFALTDVASDTTDAEEFVQRVGHLDALLSRVNNDRGLWASLYMVFADENMEQRFVHNGLRVERRPFRACAVALSLSLLALAVYVTAEGRFDHGIISAGAPATLFSAFAASLVFVGFVRAKPPSEVWQVLLLLGVYYCCGAAGIVGAGLAQTTYFTKNVFYLRMAFAVLKGSVVSIPALYGAFHDLLGPTLAATIALYVTTAAQQEERNGGAPNIPSHSATRIAWLRGEYTVWLAASFVVGVLCRVANETSNRRNFLVEEAARAAVGELRRQTARGERLISRVVPARLNTGILDWFSDVMSYRAWREALGPIFASTSLDKPNASFSASGAMLPNALPRRPPSTFLRDMPNTVVVFAQLVNHSADSIVAAQHEDDRLRHGAEHREPVPGYHQSSPLLPPAVSEGFTNPEEMARLRAAAAQVERSLLAPLDAVDALLAGPAFSSLMKIKTVCDTVLIASMAGHSLDDEAVAKRDVVRQAVDFVKALARLCPGGSVRAGIHVGDVTGCVLGLDRLSFDVLGDAVNTASRHMSTSVVGEFGLSEAAVDRLDPAVLASMHLTTTTRKMKGKGHVPVYTGALA